jgi:hypothetical protein
VTSAELESSWSALQPPKIADGITGRRVAGLPANRPVYLAVDSRGRRHLLVQIPDSTGPLNQRETRSLEVTTARFRVGTNPESLFVDLLCTDPAQHSTFCAIAQDLIRSIGQSFEPLRDSILSALARWRAFWTVKAGGMSREEVLGLFGEMWFLRRWCGTVDTTILKGWQPTGSSRHDFQWPSSSVEVKTAATQSAGPPLHRISSLEQLADPEQGKLYLFSLQVCDDALAMNTLQTLVDSLIADLQSDFQALDEFNTKLAARGYSPADCQFASRSLRILGERLYCVDPIFPRIIRESFGASGAPLGVVRITYDLDLAACDNWLIARRPQEVGTLFHTKP